MPPKIHSHVAKDGTRSYWFRVDVGRGEAGRRVQERHTFTRRGDAVGELARIMAESRQGTYVRPSDETLSETLSAWYEGAARDLRPSTRINYRDALQPVHDRLGSVRTQAVRKSDVDRLVSAMLASGRRRGGQAGTGLSPRTVRLTLQLLTAALDLAVAEGKLARNPAKLVRPPALAPRHRDTWSAAEVRAFLAEADADRLAACWRLSLYGLRRGEVLGLRWPDVDLAAGTLTVRRARVLAGYVVHEGAPKSSNGMRTLPLDGQLADALRALRKAQAAERLAAGPAYDTSGYVAADELGAPVHPEWYTDEFRRVAARAGVRRIRLHESRHTALSLMEKAGVPVSVIAAWAGHYSGAFTMATYVHARADDLAAGRDALAAVYGGDGAR